MRNCVNVELILIQQPSSVGFLLFWLINLWHNYNKCWNTWICRGEMLTSSRVTLAPELTQNKAPETKCVCTGDQRTASASIQQIKLWRNYSHTSDDSHSFRTTVWWGWQRWNGMKSENSVSSTQKLVSSRGRDSQQCRKTCRHIYAAE